MRVLMIGWEFPPHISGGLGTACAGLTRALARAGHDVLLVLPVGVRAVDIPNVRVVTAEALLGGASVPHLRAVRPYPAPGSVTDDPAGFGKGASTGVDWPLAYTAGDWQDAVRAYALVSRELASREQFDIIHCHDWLCIPAGLEARRISGKPLILHMHSIESDRSGDNLSRNIQEIERAGLTTAERIVAVSDRAKARILAEYHVPDDKISVVHNGVAMPPAAPVSTGTGRRIGRDGSGAIVLFLGRITWQKGPGAFLQAAAVVVKTLPGVRFIMAGSGDQVSAMMSQARALGIGERVIFPGFVDSDAVRRLMTGCDLFVMPSLSEPFGIAALEAASCGLPVIVSDCCGVIEVLPDAVRVPTGDVDKLAGAMLELLQAPDAHRRRLGTGNQAAAQACTWDNVAVRLTRIYDGKDV